MSPVLFMMMTLLANLTAAADTGGFQLCRIPALGHQLSGYYYSAGGSESKPIIVFCQGLPGEVGDELGLGKSLSAAGYHFITFNYSGIYGSEGSQGLANAQKDIAAILSFIKNPRVVEKFNLDSTRIILGGYSFGGGMALTYAQHHTGINKVFSIAGTDHGVFAEEISADTTYMRQMQAYFEKYLKQPYGPVRFAFDDPIAELLQDPDYYHNNKHAQQLANVDVLLIGAADDGNVTLENHVLPLYRQLKKNRQQKVTLRIYQTDHSFGNVLDILAKDVSDWIGRPE